jgi:hypothetical protein
LRRLVPELIADGQRYETDKEKAKVIMATFFPTPLISEGHNPDRPTRKNKKQDIEWLLLTKCEVERAIFKSVGKSECCCRSSLGFARCSYA